MSGHLDGTTLRAWLDGDDGDPVVTEHLESCDQCADRLVHGAEDGPALGGLLTGAFEPASGFDERIRRGVSRRLAERRAARAFMDLFGAGVESARLIFWEDDDDG